MKNLYKFLLTLLFICFGFSFSAHFAHASTSERVYVANTSANTVSVIDSVTNNVISTVPVGQNPGYKIAVSPDGSKVYVPNITDGTVSVIDAQSNSIVTTIPVGGEADDIAIKSDGSQVYVANLSNTLVQVINTQTDAVDQTIDVGDTTKCLLMSPDGSRLYVADFTNNAISVVNTSSNTISSVITGFGKDPCGMAITPDNSKLYVSTYDSQTGAHAVAVINANTNALITTVPMNTLSGLAMSPDGSKVYVVNDNCCGGGNGTVTVLDTQTNGVIATITVGLTPNHAVVTSDGSTIYVDDQGSNSVSVIDATTNTEVSRISVGAGPNGLGIGVAPNTPPVVNPFSGATINEGATYTANGSFTDADSTSWTATVDYGDGSGSHSLTLSGMNFSLSHVYKDNGTYTVTVSVTDNHGATGTGTATITVNNVAPTVGTITVATSPVQVNNSITASANFTDPGVLDTHTASWNWGDGNTTSGTVTESNGSGAVSNTHTYTATGVYTVTLTVTDNNNGAGTALYQYVVVYDPSAGWVSGDKEFTSPAGAVTGNSSATGTAKFGFQVKYQNGSMVPSGKNVSLSFPTGNITFSSTGYEWLVINGSKATFKADGTLNGTSGYKLLVSAIDQGNGNPSGLVRFQIKDSGGNVVYDTQPSAADTADPTTSVTKGKIAVH